MIALRTGDIVDVHPKCELLSTFPLLPSESPFLGPLGIVRPLLKGSGVSLAQSLDPASLSFHLSKRLYIHFARPSYYFKEDANIKENYGNLLHLTLEWTFRHSLITF